MMPYIAWEMVEAEVTYLCTPSLCTLLTIVNEKILICELNFFSHAHKTTHLQHTHKRTHEYIHIHLTGEHN